MTSTDQVFLLSIADFTDLLIKVFIRLFYSYICTQYTVSPLLFSSFMAFSLPHSALVIPLPLSWAGTQADGHPFWARSC